MDWSGYEVEGQMNIFDLEAEEKMKEITRITTVQITHIFSDEPERIADKISSEEEKLRYADHLKKRLDFLLNPDDVNVTNVQVFVRDMEE